MISREEVERQTELSILIADNKTLEEENQGLRREKENIMSSLISATNQLEEEKNHSKNLIEEVKRLNGLIKSSPQIYTVNMEGEQRVKELLKDLKAAHEELLRCDKEYGKLKYKVNQYEKIIEAIRTIADIRY